MSSTLLRASHINQIISIKINKSEPLNPYIIITKKEKPRWAYPFLFNSLHEDIHSSDTALTFIAENFHCSTVNKFNQLPKLVQTMITSNKYVDGLKLKICIQFDDNKHQRWIMIPCIELKYLTFIPLLDLMKLIEEQHKQSGFLVPEGTLRDRIKSVRFFLRT